VIALRQLKRKIVKTEIEPGLMTLPGGFVPSVGDNRSDNSWLQYDKETLPVTAEQWNNTKFVDDTAIGFSVWPK